MEEEKWVVVVIYDIFGWSNSSAPAVAMPHRVYRELVEKGLLKVDRDTAEVYVLPDDLDVIRCSSDLVKRFVSLNTPYKVMDNYCC